MYFYFKSDYIYSLYSGERYNGNFYSLPRFFNGKLYDLSENPYVKYGYTGANNSSMIEYLYYDSSHSIATTTSQYFDNRLIISENTTLPSVVPGNITKFTLDASQNLKGKRAFILRPSLKVPTCWYQPIQFQFNNKNYIGIKFTNKSTDNTNANLNNIVRFARVENESVVWDNVIDETGFLIGSFPDTNIDFGTANQEVCKTFYDWIYANTTEAKTAKIIIKEGDTTLAESPMIPPYTSISLATVGNRTTLTTNNGDKITFDTKDNFSGLSESKIALYPTIRDGTTTYFANTGEVTFYTCYKPSRPLPNNFLCSFYRCDAEENRVDKTDYLSDKQDFYITLKDEAPILGMSIFLDLTNINMNWDIPKWNYCYLHKFNRWYFCELKSVYNNVWEFKLSEDVLMSFKDQISGLQGMVERNQTIFDRDIPDDLILTKAYPVIEHSELSPLQDIFKPDDELNDYFNYLIILRG